VDKIFHAQSLMMIMMIDVSSYMKNVTLKDITLNSVKILHLLISTLKSNLLEFQKDKLFTCTTYHVSMV